MSYSFGVQSATKEGALMQVGSKMREVIAQQPIHAKDEEAAVLNATNAINLLADDDASDVSVSCSGYLSWTGLDQKIAQVNVSCTASLVDRKKAA